MKKIFVLYGIIFFLFSVIFLGLFRLNLFTEKALFYRGLIFLVATIVILFALFIPKTKDHFESLLSAIILSAAIHLSIFIIFPVTVDRSITVFMLNTLARNNKSAQCNGLTTKQIENELVTSFVKKGNAINKRVQEQETIDFISSKNQCITITDKGRSFVNSFAVVKSIYNLH